MSSPCVSSCDLCSSLIPSFRNTQSRRRSTTGLLTPCVWVGASVSVGACRIFDQMSSSPSGAQVTPDQGLSHFSMTFRAAVTFKYLLSSLLSLPVLVLVSVWIPCRECVCRACKAARRQEPLWLAQVSRRCLTFHSLTGRGACSVSSGPRTAHSSCFGIGRG